MATYLSFRIQDCKFASTGLYARLTDLLILCARGAMLQGGHKRRRPTCIYVLKRKSRPLGRLFQIVALSPD